MAEIQLNPVEIVKYVNSTKQSLSFPVSLPYTEGGNANIFILFEIPASCKMKKCKLRLDANCNGMTAYPPPYSWQSSYLNMQFKLIDNTQEIILPTSPYANTNNIHDDEGEVNWNISTYLFKDGYGYAGKGGIWVFNWSNGYAYPYNGNPNTIYECGAVITTAKYILINPYIFYASANLLNATLYIEPLEDVCFTDPTYPIDVNINQTNATIFTWDMYHKLPSGYGFNVPTITKHSVLYKEKGSSTLQSITEVDGNTYQTVPANTFNVKKYEYQIVAYTYDDLPMYGEVLKEFNVIGANAAPLITGVTNNSIPTISWTDQNQAAFEVRIKDSSQKILYTSGLIVGNNLSYKINKMLPNGEYTVEVRELNIYGIYSDWGSAPFTLNPSSVAAPTNIWVTVNNKYGVEISGTPASGAQKTYVVRRIVGTEDIEIIGIYTGGIFTDYTTKGNTYYEYTLRNYNVAYADGEWTPVEIKVGEALIQDGRDLTNFLDLSWSENAIFNMEQIEETNRTLYKCLGRTYPVKELSEWVNSVRTFTAYVNADDLDRLRDINLNAPKVYYKGNHEYYACDMSIEDNGAYVGGGRMISFTLTRIADDEGVVI